MCASMASVVQVSTGPMVRSCKGEEGGGGVGGRAQGCWSSTARQPCAPTRANDGWVGTCTLSVTSRGAAPLQAPAADLQLARGRPLAQLVQQPGAPPVAVHEHDRLRAALLAAACVRVLVALPCHVVHVAHVWAQHLQAAAGCHEGPRLARRASGGGVQARPGGALEASCVGPPARTQLLLEERGAAAARPRVGAVQAAHTSHGLSSAGSQQQPTFQSNPASSRKILPLVSAASFSATR
jgi:hypothetical protein